MKLVQLLLVTCLGTSLGQDVDKISRFNDILAGFGFSGSSQFGTKDDAPEPLAQPPNRRPSQPVGLSSSQPARFGPSQPARPAAGRPQRPAALANLLAVAEETKSSPRAQPTPPPSRAKAGTSRFDEIVAGFGFGRDNGQRSQSEQRAPQPSFRSQPDLRAQPRSQPAQRKNSRSQKSQSISSGREFSLASTSAILGGGNSQRSQRPSPNPPRPSPTRAPKPPRPNPTQPRRPPRPSPIQAQIPSQNQPSPSSRSQKIPKSKNKSSALANLFNLVTEDKPQPTSRPQKQNQARPQQPRPTPARAQQPRPSPTRPQQPRPSPTRPQQPKPSPTRPQQPRPTPARPQQSRPPPTKLQNAASSFDFERDFDSFGKGIVTSSQVKQSNKVTSVEAQQPNSGSRSGGRRRPPETRQSIEARRGPTNRPETKPQNARTSQPINNNNNRLNEIDVGVSRQASQKQSAAIVKAQKEQRTRFEAALESIRQRPPANPVPPIPQKQSNQRGRNPQEVQPVNRPRGQFQGQPVRINSRPSGSSQASPLENLLTVAEGQRQRGQQPAKQESRIQSATNDRTGSSNRQGSQFSLQSTHAILGNRNNQPVSKPGSPKVASSPRGIAPSGPGDNFGLGNLLKVAGNPRRPPTIKSIQTTAIPAVSRASSRGSPSSSRGNPRGVLNNLLNIAGDPNSNPVAEKEVNPVISSIFNRGQANEAVNSQPRGSSTIQPRGSSNSQPRGSSTSQPRGSSTNRPRGSSTSRSRGSSDPTLNNLLSIAEGKGPTLVVNSRARSGSRKPPSSAPTSVRQPPPPRQPEPITKKPFVVINSFITKAPVSITSAKKVNENSIGRGVSLSRDSSREQEDRVTPKILRVNQKQRTSSRGQSDDRIEPVSKSRSQSTRLSESQQKQTNRESSVRDKASSITLDDNPLRDNIRPDDLEELPRSSSLDHNRQNQIESTDRRKSEKNDRRTDLPLRAGGDRRKRPQKNRFDDEYDEDYDYEYEDRKQQLRPKKSKKNNKNKKKKKPSKLRPPISPTCLRVCETLIFEVYQLLGGTLCDCS